LRRGRLQVREVLGRALVREGLVLARRLTPRPAAPPWYTCRGRPRGARWPKGPHVARALARLLRHRDGALLHPGSRGALRRLGRARPRHPARPRRRARHPGGEQLLLPALRDRDRGRDPRLGPALCSAPVGGRGLPPLDRPAHARLAEAGAGTRPPAARTALVRARLRRPGRQPEGDRLLRRPPPAVPRARGVGLVPGARPRRELGADRAPRALALRRARGARAGGRRHALVRSAGARRRRRPDRGGRAARAGAFRVARRHLEVPMGARIFLGLFGLISLPYGLYCFLHPDFLGPFAGVSATSTTGTVELRAMYGGLQAGFGALALLGAFRPAFTRTALLSTAFLCAGLGSFRLLGALAAGEVSSYP